MPTIYLVTEGDYSSYRVTAAFDDRDLAESFRKTWNDVAGSNAYNDVEEFELNPTHPPIGMYKEARYRVGVGGTLLPDLGYSEEPRVYAAKDRIRMEPMAHVYCQGNGIWIVSVRCAADQDPHKIASDAVAQHLAEEAGIA